MGKAAARGLSWAAAAREEARGEILRGPCAQAGELEAQKGLGEGVHSLGRGEDGGRKEERLWQRTWQHSSAPRAASGRTADWLSGIFVAGGAPIEAYTRLRLIEQTRLVTLGSRSQGQKTRSFSKADIDLWAASNYAPRLQAGESRKQYGSRLTHVSRKNPLLDACRALKIRVPKNANLELRSELVKHWFTPRSSSATGSSTMQQTNNDPPLRRATDAHDVLASVLIPQGRSFHLPPPTGSPPHAPSNARGELRGGAPLMQVVPSRPESSFSARSKGKQKELTTPISRPIPTRPSTPVLPELPQFNTVTTTDVFGGSGSGSGTLGRQHADTHSPLIVIRPEQESDTVGQVNDAALLREYDVPGAKAYEILGYEDDDDDEEEEGERDLGPGDDADNEESSEDDEDDESVNMDAFRRGVRIAAVKRAEGNRRAGGRKTQAAMVLIFKVLSAVLYTKSQMNPGFIKSAKDHTENQEREREREGERERDPGIQDLPNAGVEAHSRLEVVFDLVDTSPSSPQDSKIVCLLVASKSRSIEDNFEDAAGGPLYLRSML
ncbi:hypothetical protein R3P38DRAFT_2786629 [Favolaschia claudopus]|uniref:Uncharacterized protein n=1 Tax=Favolaschia claudopus TaxID=2862362 RepID=A0AAW0ARP4_9AGAR